MTDSKQAKRKILFISDHPLVPSGVGTQSRYLIEGLLATERYSFVCFGGAVKHPDYTRQKIAPEKYGDDWIIIPVDGYGNKDLMRRTLAEHKPDAVLIFTDPRQFMWLFEMEDEVRAVCPLLYWHVWDNDPTPMFNKVYYDSTDLLVALSLKTYGLLQDLGIDKKRRIYIPHSVSENLFKPLLEEEVQRYKRDHFGPHADKKFIVFWNNRNARRKMTGDVIASFAKFAANVGKENVALMMHTSVHDPEGQDINAVSKRFGIDSNMIISESRIPPEEMNWFYNACDCTVNIANNEGFGLGTLESLSAGTPIIVHMTGGLQYQIGDWYDGINDFRDQDKLTAIAKKKFRDRQQGGTSWWGVPVFSASRSCTGSQQIPYIYDDRVNHDDVIKALNTLYCMGRINRKQLGVKAREWVIKNFNHEQMVRSWDSAFKNTIDLFVKNKATTSSFNVKLASL